MGEAISSAKDIRDITRELENQGWTVEPTSRGHFQARPPDKTKRIVVFSTSGDLHAQRNMLRDLRQQGFVWPPLSLPKKPPSQLTGDATISTTDFRDEVDTFLKVLDKAEEDMERYSPAPRSSEQPVPAAESDDERMNRLFTALKEARSYHSLAAEAEREAQACLLAAQRKLEGAQEELRRAAKDLSEKKALFDSHFSSTAAA
jgi:predicted RNA binding protein YcfA (HicA-like mRNA interferase family)